MPGETKKYNGRTHHAICKKCGHIQDSFCGPTVKLSSKTCTNCGTFGSLRVNHYWPPSSNPAAVTRSPPGCPDPIRIKPDPDSFPEGA